MVEGGDPCWRINWFDLSGDGEDRLAKKPREQELQNDRYHLSLNIYPAILRSYKLKTSDGKRIFGGILRYDSVLIQGFQKFLGFLF